MLDIKFIRENAEQVKEAIKNKNKNVDVDRLLELYDKFCKLSEGWEDIRRKRNNINEEIKNAGSDDNLRNSLIEVTSKLKDKEKEISAKLADVSETYRQLLLSIPNVTSPKMPVGKDESENQVIRQWGDKPEFNFQVKDHVDIGKALDIIDVETSGTVSGSRFYYLKNEAVMLQFAIVQFVFETLSDKGLIKKLAKKVENSSDKTFSPVLPPVMMKPEIMKKMDRLDPIEERYELKLDDLILVGSAEHTLGPMHMDHTFEKSELPIRYIGYSTAFRREAGSHGKDVRGILRSHQFDKLEIETFTTAEDGESEQELIVALQEYMMQKLNLPYQIVQICTGDTGKPDYNQYDIETWIPSQEMYRETHTSDYMTDYQSRRLNIKYQNSAGEKEYVHMNDATAFAIGRILIAILENNQKEDGSVEVPKALRKYLEFKKIEIK